MEKDDEHTQEKYDFGARIYDARLGKMLTVDALTCMQPGMSPYKSFLNNPIIYIDPNGNVEYLATTYINETGGDPYTVITLVDADKTYTKIVAIGAADAHYYAH